MEGRREVHMDERIYQLSRRVGADESSDENTGARQKGEPAFKVAETSNKDDSMLDVSQVAEYLRISRSMVYKLIEGQRIPAIRIGRLLRVRKDELDNAIRSTGNNI